MKHTFEGTASWAKVFEHNRDMQGFKGANIQCDGKYTIDLEVNDETKDRIKSTGTMKQGRRENPNIFRFDRKHKHSVEAFGGAPEVFNEAGAPRVRPIPMTQFMEFMARPREQKILETYWNPRITIHDNLATSSPE